MVKTTSLAVALLLTPSMVWAQAQTETQPEPAAPAEAAPIATPSAPVAPSPQTLPAPARNAVAPPASAPVMVPTSVPPTGTNASSSPGKEQPFSGDFTWMNGQSRQKEFPLKFNEIVTLSAYLDAYYAFSGNRPKDNTLTGNASVGRHNEFQINLASLGVDLAYKNVLGRLSLQMGNMIDIVQNLDGTTSRGRSLSKDNLRYIREATLGYHFDVHHGLNVEAGIFMSYIGLESYLLAENWNYTRAIASDHTPFYFQGVRAQYFPLKNVKIEPWLMNGWQTYGKWNSLPSAGTALRWSPYESLTFLSNFYLGTDTRGEPGRVRFHNDHSILARYYNAPDSRFLSKLAFSLNNNIGFETGGDGLPGPSGAHMLATSLAHRAAFFRDHLALAVRGELFTNPSRYAAQYPPPGFASGAGENLRQWALTTTFEVMPTSFMSIRAEFNYRHSDSPYFAGRNGTTSSDGYQGTTNPDGSASVVADGQKSQALYILSANFRL